MIAMCFVLYVVVVTVCDSVSLKTLASVSVCLGHSADTATSIRVPLKTLASVSVCLGHSADTATTRC